MPAVIRGPSTGAQSGSGLVSTEGVLPEQKVVDMDRTIHMLDLETDQFTTMLDDLGTEAASREKVNWLEDSYAPKIVQLNAGTTAGATSAVLKSAHKDFVKAFDTIRNLTNADTVRVSAVAADGITLTTSATGANWAATDDVLITGSAFPQGSDVGDLSYQQRVLGYNYQEIHRTAWGFTGTEMEIEQYGGRDPAMEQAKKLVEHRNLLERNGFWGQRAFTTVGANDPKPWGTSGGAFSFISSNKVDANGPLTADFVDNFLRGVYAHGSTDKVGYCHPIVAMAFSKFNRTGQGTYWQADPQNVHGVKVDGFISGAYGYKLPIIVKREWNDINEADKYAGCLFVIDNRNARRRPLRNRDTKLLTNRQAPGVDGEVNEYLTESSWQFSQEKTHGLIYGVTSVAP